MSYTDRKDTNWILNSVYNSGGTFTTRLDTNDILNLIYDESGALKVNVTNLPSGATDTICNVGPGTNILTAGTSTFQVVSTVESPLFNNITASGTSEAAVYTSGGTDLYSIFLTTADENDITRVQPGTNISTGGTANEPTVNLVASPSVNGLTASGTCEAAVYTSGGTDLYNIFLTTADGNDITRVQPGVNITTGGTANDPTINVVDSPSFNGITASGTCEAAVYTSGGTNLYSIFAKTSHTHVTSDVTNLDNLLGTKANLSAATFTGAVTIPIATSNLSGAGFISQGFAISDETTAIASAATAALTYYAPFTMKITDTFACLTTSGSTVSTFDIHLTGTTIFSTKITIDANEFTTNTAATAAVITGTTITKGQKVEFFIDGAGTGAKGAKIFINGYKA